MYRLLENNENTVQRISDGAFIPFAPGNRDYTEYLEWVNAGNTPEAAISTFNVTEYAANKRYEVEVGGCMYGNNIVQTDRDSQTKMIAEMVALGANLRPDPSPWKFGNGFANLTNAQMLEVIMTARLHIATAFAVEAGVLEQIALGNITTKEQIDAAPWPANR